MDALIEYLQNCSLITNKEKRRLCVDLTKLTPEQVDEVLKILLQNEPFLHDQNPDDMVVDMRSLKPSTLQELVKYVKSVAPR